MSAEKKVGKLLLVGPSSDIKTFSKDFFNQKMESGYNVFCFGDSLLYLKSINIKPDFFTFIDPETIYNVKSILETDFLQDTYLLVHDLYSNECYNFNKLGYTSKHLRSGKLKQQFLKLEGKFEEIFKKYIKIDFNVKEDMHKNDYLSYETFKYDKSNKVDCKFSHVMIPIIFSTFRDLKSIHCIGFGQYDIPRYNSYNSRGYKDYIESFNIAEKPIKNFLKQKEIQIKFSGRKSIFESLITE